MISFLHKPNLSRGLRNNNPGNLILTSIGWDGKIPNAQNTDGTFEQFTSANYGIRANVSTGAKGVSTVVKYAAPVAAIIGGVWAINKWVYPIFPRK